MSEGSIRPGEGGTGVQRNARAERECTRPRRWNVVLHDDDHHTYEYVIEMIQSVYGRSRAEAFLLAKRVDTEKRAVCFTSHFEHAELKREQMLAFGRDLRVASCTGPMSVVLEPAGDDQDGSSDGSGPSHGSAR